MNALYLRERNYATISTHPKTVALVHRWPVVALDYSLLDAHPALCHALAYTNAMLPELAAWTLVGISFERLIACMRL